MFDWLKEKFSNLVDALWTPFNRDTLRNLCLPYVYCTYDPSKVKPGMVFCHVDDRTQQRWIRIGAALIVTKVLGDRDFEITTRYNVGSAYGDSPKPIPIRATTLEPRKYAEGDLFTDYGQYKYNGTVLIPQVIQINTRNEHVFEEPFIDFGNGER